MKKSELKQYLETQLEKYTKEMDCFRGSENPQVKEMFLRAKGSYDSLDELYWKLFHKYY